MLWFRSYEHRTPIHPVEYVIPRGKSLFGVPQTLHDLISHGLGLMPSDSKTDAGRLGSGDDKPVVSFNAVASQVVSLWFKTIILITTTCDALAL